MKRRVLVAFSSIRNAKLISSEPFIPDTGPLVAPGARSDEEPFRQRSTAPPADRHGCYQPADHGAGHAAGDDVLAGQVQARDGGLRRQPALLEPRRVMVQSVDLAGFVATEIIGRQR